MFVAGMAAAVFGLGKVAFLGAVNEERTRRLAASFLAGAMYVDPKYELPENYAYDFVGSWSDADAAYSKATTILKDQLGRFLQGEQQVHG
jgi:basic membrane lipoprotein Med (substrate-binding protein (PBP1-ABC) superfamily)